MTAFPRIWGTRWRCPFSPLLFNMGTRMAAKKGRKRNQRENIRKIEKNCLFHKHKHCLSRQSHRTYKTNFFWKQQKSLAKLQNIMSTPENQPHFYIVGVNYQKPKKIKFFKICSFLAVLGLHCCVQDFSSCGKQGLLYSWTAAWWLLWLQSMGSTAVAHGLSYPEACGIFPDRGLNPHPLQWQTDSQPLSHQASP